MFLFALLHSGDDWMEQGATILPGESGDKLEPLGSDELKDRGMGGVLVIGVGFSERDKPPSDLEEKGAAWDGDPNGDDGCEGASALRMSSWL